jgi:hypothetical protein
LAVIDPPIGAFISGDFQPTRSPVSTLARSAGRTNSLPSPPVALGSSANAMKDAAGLNLRLSRFKFAGTLPQPSTGSKRTLMLPRSANDGPVNLLLY